LPDLAREERIVHEFSSVGAEEETDGFAAEKAVSAFGGDEEEGGDGADFKCEGFAVYGDVSC
jgi:hypothetical protein